MKVKKKKTKSGNKKMGHQQQHTHQWLKVRTFEIMWPQVPLLAGEQDALAILSGTQFSMKWNNIFSELKIQNRERNSMKCPSQNCKRCGHQPNLSKTRLLKNSKDKAKCKTILENYIKKAGENCINSYFGFKLFMLGHFFPPINHFLT